MNRAGLRSFGRSAMGVFLFLGFGTLGFVPIVPATPAKAQDPPEISAHLPSGEVVRFSIETHRGYPAVSVDSLGRLGWVLGADGTRERPVIRHRTGLRIQFLSGAPYLTWDDRLLQTAHASYWVGDQFHVPLQLVVDLFPGLLPQAYEFDPVQGILRVEGARVDGTDMGMDGASPPPPASVGDAARAPRIVVIDPGHGGGDPGAVGPSGVQEKDVALALARALAEELSGDPGLEVRLTRDRDVEVPLWTRGEWATEWKRDRPGVFLSLHTNALTERPEVRGFETYFLSEARDEHERRVAAAENAPLIRSEGGMQPPGNGDPLLDLILRDLRTFDHQHWSALLAEEVQRELGTFHPGPDRGVKQGPFAVITNSMMPSVLVEVGFITHPEEEQLLTRPEFHQDTARALARAVQTFFSRYPPGSAGP